MPTELSNLDLNEVSLVDDGANEDAKVLLYKRGKFKTEYGRQFPMGDYAYVPDPTKPSTWKLRLTADPGGGPNARIVGAAVAALGPTGFRGRKVQIPKNDLPKVKAKVLAAWKKLHPDAKELPASLTKMSATEERDVLKFYMFGEKGGKDMTPEELEKRLGELEEQVETQKAANDTLMKERDEALAKAKSAEEEVTALKEKMPPGKEEDEDEDMEKRADVPEAVQKKMDELAKQNKEQADEIAKMKEDTARKEMVAKVSAAYPDLPVSAEELGEALRGISKAAPGSLEIVEKALTAGQEAIKKALTEQGVGGDGGEQTALAELEKCAAEIVKRDGITKEAAFVKAKNENPDLWKQHRKEARSAH